MSEPASTGSIRRYLTERLEASTRGTTRGAGARVLRALTPWSFRQWAKVNGTLLLVPLTVRRARRLARGYAELQLNLGSGPEKKPGWINVDIVGMSPDLHWDLRRDLPFPDGSAKAVFLEHVLEHFSIGDGLGLLEKCRRVLRSGGVLRVGVPDFGRYARSYSGDRAFLEQLRPGRPTALLAMAEVALGHGHRSVWDEETLELVLRESGFVDVSTRKYGESALDPVPDTPLREAESVYAEARKP